MSGVAHFRERRRRRGDDFVGDHPVEPARNPARRTRLDLGADEILVGGERGFREGDCALQDFLRLALGPHDGEQVAGHRRGGNRPDAGDDGVAQCIGHQFARQCPRHLRHHHGGVAGDPLGVVGAAQPIGHPLRGIDLHQLFRQHFGRQEVVGDEPPERPGDAGLVARHDPGVGNRKSQGPPEQRHHREPVGASADHAGLGECPHISEPFPSFLRGRGRREHHRHRHQQQRRDHAHPPQVRDAGVFGSAIGGSRPRHATSAPPLVPPHHLRACRPRAASSA